MAWESVCSALAGAKTALWKVGEDGISLREGNFAPGDLSMTDYRVQAGESQEDQVTSAIEKVTSKAPSSLFLGLAIAAIGASVACQAFRKEHASLFVGQWVAPFLLLGIYNKMVKQHGSDATKR